MEEKTPQLINEETTKEEKERIDNEENKNEKVKQILDKWLTVQKTIKEEITLKETINNQKKESENQLKKNYFDYYKYNLLSRRIKEKINILKYEKKTTEDKELTIDDNPEIILENAYDPIKKFFSLLRNNYNYIIQIFNILNNQDDNFQKENEKQISSVMDLFSHQFFDNIIIPNPEHEELLILIFLLLEKEILSVNSASISTFLDFNKSIVGKFLQSFITRPELKDYISSTLNNIILSIEDLGRPILDLNIVAIDALINNNKKNTSESSNYIQLNEKFDNLLIENIPKCRIDLNKRISELELNENEEEEEVEDDIEQIKNNKDIGKVKKSKTANPEINISEKINHIQYSYDYLQEINQQYLLEKIKNEKNPNLKEFYLKQLEKVISQPSIFSNDNFLKNLNHYEETKKILMIYKQNFIYIQNFIDKIIQALINKISSIPYPIRCICKIIFMLISKKFPKISKYEKNAFIGEFIFGRWIFPILINSDTNAIITSTILSSSTKNCIRLIGKVLTKVNNGLFFESNFESENTIFNHYIIELIPIINEFYDRLIDVQFPKMLNDIIEKNMEIPIYSLIKDTHMRSVVIDDNNNLLNKIEIPNYDYFSINPEELINIHCICFSLDDILFLVRTIKNNIQSFKHLVKYNFFSKTIDKILNEESKLTFENNKEENFGRFFLIYDVQEQKDKLFKEEKTNYSKEENTKDSTFILKRILFCIKTVLLGLNYLNNKDYPYLNAASSSKKFFLALKYTLEDFNELEEGKFKKEIPLKWYSQYISNNKKMLDENHRKNDYEQLYIDLYNQEDLILKNLKDLSSIINTRYGLNKRCAEKKIEQALINSSKMRVVEKFFKVENFINKVEFECYYIENNEKNIIEIKSLDSESKKVTNKLQYLEGFVNGIGFKQKSSVPKIKNIKQFIHKFTKSNNSNKNNIKEYAIEDIKNGNQEHKISETFNQFFEVLKEQLKENPIFSYDKDNNYNNIIIIENHIHKKIYNKVFPPHPLKKDDDFYRQTLKLSWIKPEHLDIKKIYINELKFTENYIVKMEEKKSIYEKLNCISEAYDIINNTIKFCSGKNEDAGADDLAPIFQYIIIKARPRRFFSNIYYIKCFMRNEQNRGMYGFFLSQLEFSAEFVNNINHVKVKMSKEEFDKKMTLPPYLKRKSLL